MHEEHRKGINGIVLLFILGAFGEPKIRVGKTDSSNFPMQAQASLRKNSALESAYQ
jgi:hypothetical protein